MLVPLMTREVSCLRTENPEARSDSSSSTLSLVAPIVGGFVVLLAGVAAAFAAYWYLVLRRSSDNDQGSAAQPGPSATASNTAPSGETSNQSDKCSIS